MLIRINLIALMVLSCLSIGLYAQSPVIISHDLTEKQIDDEISRYIREVFEIKGIEENKANYDNVKEVIVAVEMALSKIKQEQYDKIENYDKYSDNDIKETLKLFHNLYLAERSLSNLLLNGYYKNSNVYNAQLLSDMGLIQREVVNLKAYQEQMDINIRKAHEAVNVSYDSMKNLADIIEGYKNIIAEQQKIIGEQIMSAYRGGKKDFGNITFSALGGTGWYGEAVLAEPDVQVGFALEFALSESFGLGLGAMTSLPVRGNMVFLEVSFSPGG